MTVRGLPVPIRARDEIGLIAQVVRQKCNALDHPRFPIVEVVEAIVQDGFEVLEHGDIGSNYGLTYPDANRMLIRKDTYDAACDGKGWAREVMAHELGHLILHRGIPLPFASKEAEEQKHSILGDSEWQANTFAELLLAPLEVIRGIADTSEIASLCGISQETAFRRWVEAKCR